MSRFLEGLEPFANFYLQNQRELARTQDDQGKVDHELPIFNYEVGHHIGLAHPHDGYDGATGELFAPPGPTFFAWLGDQSNTMMSYIDLNWDFSQFDHDNLDRFRTAALNQAANDLAAEALAAPFTEPVKRTGSTPTSGICWMVSPRCWQARDACDVRTDSRRRGGRGQRRPPLSLRRRPRQLV
ncbi:hypothetical protein ACGFIF_28700 [Kribbella sp. NPDC049174]|uniref:hypothetical protein n=1 Tax=Kribbella sp. NPDC049174 TaxID=3364112 RepID=UPI00371D03FC